MRDIKFRVFYDNDFTYFDLDLLNEESRAFYINEVMGNQVMQYTGLKDAINKSEVYEHDIINFLGVGFLKVEWDYKDTGWICLDKRYKKRSLVDVLLSGGIKVGNIYETPELLKDKENDNLKI